jgi:acetolactate synthase-1/2/3 large subunit
MAANPAMCLLHLGQGLANGLTNLHNARRAFTPVVNVIGDHATWHLPADPLLATDVESLARTVSDHVKKCLGATTVARDMADAIDAAMDNGRRIATLIVPHDAQIGEASDGMSLRRDRAKKTYSSSRVVQAAKAAGMRCLNPAFCSPAGSLPSAAWICCAITSSPVWNVVAVCLARRSCPISPTKR